MTTCHFGECRDVATTIILEIYVQHDERFLDAAGGVFCNVHCPPCVTGKPRIGYLWNCVRPHLMMPISGEGGVEFTTVHRHRRSSEE